MSVETAGNHVVQALNVVYWTTYYYPAGTYLLKVNNRNTRVRCEICSKLTIKTPETQLVSLLLTLNIFHGPVFLSLTLNMEMPTGQYALVQTLVRTNHDDMMTSVHYSLVYFSLEFQVNCNKNMADMGHRIRLWVDLHFFIRFWKIGSALNCSYLPIVQNNRCIVLRP